MKPGGLFLICCWVGAELAAGKAMSQPANRLETVRLIEVIDGDTIRVWLEQRQETVRYESVEAPELAEAGGREARRANEELLRARDLWLEAERDDQGALARDGHKRVLGYVYLDAAGKQCVNVELVRQGAARIGVRGVGDDTPENAFALLCLEELIKAQVEAARNRRGWWGAGDPYAESNLLVCFVKFWGRDEVVWLLNRGRAPVNLSDNWRLTDSTQKKPLLLRQCFPQANCDLPPGGVCRIHTGSEARRGEPQCEEPEMDLLWKRQRVWNNTGDQAFLNAPEGNLVYSYTYKAAKG
ncbi:MAG: lamin tail domain-containing protein [Armatimonadetes bacterium]|nr:lamin tail domain-containing protein [Armatimonadota bacterium]